MKITATLSMLAVAAMLMMAGCGQKGPLYLPPKNGTVITRPPNAAPPPLPADKDKKDDSQAPQSTPPSTQTPQ
jgi:predicted small lipoprotein YifL